MSQFRLLPDDVKTLIARDLPIPSFPPESVLLNSTEHGQHVYTTPFGQQFYYDPFEGQHFNSLYDECQQRTQSLDIARRRVDAQRDKMDEEGHFERLRRIERELAASIRKSKARTKNEHDRYSKDNLVFRDYIRIFNFQQQILNRKLALYRQQRVYEA